MTLAAIHSHRTELFNSLFRNYHQAPFSIRTPGGWRWNSSPSDTPAFSLSFKTSEALQALLRNPTEVSLGEAFINADIDIEGDFCGALAVAEHIFARPFSLSADAVRTVQRVISGAADWVCRGRQHSRHRDQTAIAYHYDQPAQFFRPWLGPTMVYSCAYFRDANNDLDSAQTNKLDLICRKLGLQPEERFLDIGCGWGSLVLHAASRYGAQARGITISKEQAYIAARRISEAELGKRCFVEVRDYRDTLRLPYRYDKMASVGMFEHVGHKNLGMYFRIAYQLLKPGGSFLNHGIARSYTSPATQDSFIEKYVFPDGELVTLSDAVKCAESAGFEVRDVENLREHYAQTLRLWVQRLQSDAAAVLAKVPEKTYRIWLLYMAGSAAAFQNGDIAINQILLRRSERTRVELPSTRERWYQNWNPTESLRSA